MKEFLKSVSEMMGQLETKRCYDLGTLERMKISYEKLSDVERKKVLSLLSNLLEEDYTSYFYIMSTFLSKLREEEIVHYIEKMLLSEEPQLWDRIEAMYQLKLELFRTSVVKDKQTEHKGMKTVYKKILREVAEMQNSYAWIPWDSREKRVVLVVNQILRRGHAPSRKLWSIWKYFKELGYEVSVYVSLLLSKKETNLLLWYDAQTQMNLLEKTAPFVFSVEDEEMEGYNLCLGFRNYLQDLEKAIDRIYEQRPEFVFELGDVTLLAGLCQSFTTVVTMGFTKAVPVTTAPIIARYFMYSEEDERKYRECLEDNQTVIDVPHMNIGEIELEEVGEIEREAVRIRQELNIGEDRFAILIVGNRLDIEVTEAFLDILYCILKQSEKYILVFVGACNRLQKKVADSSYRDQMLFLGRRDDFKEVMAMGDLFLNPPRQGGGTGAFYAAIGGVPVITLDHCDVEGTVGNAFVCESLEQMPALVSRYYTDSAFYEKRKKEIKAYVRKKLAVDSKGNFRKLCEKVKEVTLEIEKAKEINYGK